MRMPTLTPLFSSSDVIYLLGAPQHLDHAVFNLTMVLSKQSRGRMRIAMQFP